MSYYVWLPDFSLYMCSALSVCCEVKFKVLVVVSIYQIQSRAIQSAYCQSMP